MSNSPFSALMEAIKKAEAALSAYICQVGECLCDALTEINEARIKEIERMEVEAMELAQVDAQASVNAIPFGMLLDMIKEAQDMLKEEPPAINDNMEWERPFWRGAAAFARSKDAARAQAFARQMEQEKARQAMKRRKLKHADGSFPDWECGCVR